MNRSIRNRRYGTPADQPDQRDFVFDKLLPSNQLPDQALGLKQFLPPKINQLQVGMCTGCGTSRGLKTLLNSVNYKWPFTPSALGIYAMTRIEEGTPLTTDSGAEIRDVFQVISSQGVIPEDSNKEWSWPFSASDSRWQEMPPADCLKDAALHKVIKYSRVDQTEQAIKSVLAQNLPIVIGISVYSSFESNAVAATGMVPMPMFWEPLLGGHCLFLYGYGEKALDHADGVNSWGEDWGDGGNFHISFKYLCNPKLTSDLWVPEIIA